MDATINIMTLPVVFFINILNIHNCPGDDTSSFIYVDVAYFCPFGAVVF